MLVAQTFHEIIIKKVGSNGMKILQVYPYFFPAWDYGGVTRVAYNLSIALADRKHTVLVYTTDALDKNQRYVPESNPVIHRGIEIYYFKNLSNFLTYKYKIPLPLLMPFFIKNQMKNFDIIHLHGHRHFLSFVIYLFARKYQIPYVIQTHGDLPYAYQESGDVTNFFKRPLKILIDFLFGKKILKNAAKCIALTKIESDQYSRMGVPENKIVIIPNGIDISEYEMLPERGRFRKKYGIGSEEKVILYLGRLHERKGIDFLINGFLKFQLQYKNTKLVIAGPDDGFQDILIKQVKKLKIGDITIFTGPLSETEKLEAFVDASVLVYPGILEIFGLVPLEALLCETPVIVSDDCGCGEIIKDAMCGYSIRYNDVVGLSKMIRYVLEHPEANTKMTRAGRQYIKERLTWENVVNQVEDMYIGCKQ